MARMRNGVKCGLLDGDGVHESEAVVALELYEKHGVLSSREVNSGREGKGSQIGRACCCVDAREEEEEMEK
jgi:hypothetical protein